MTPARWSALLAVAVAGVAPLACSGSASDAGGAAWGPASSPGAGADAGGGIIALPPPPPPRLAFAYDEADGRLVARVRDDAPSGARIVARALRAAAGLDEPAIDCAAIAEDAEPFDLAGARRAPPLLEARGPRVAADLLPTTYGGAGGRAARSRSVVEGCLLGADGEVLARVRAGLMAAWDAGGSARVHGVQAYARACEEALGPIPMFERGALDCVHDPQATIVPVTLSDPSRPDVVVASLDARTGTWPLRGAELAATRRCDRPAWLDYSGDDASQCAPFTRVVAGVNARGTRVVVACRRYVARARDDSAFDDVNVLMHDPTSGKACFFNSRLEVPQDGTKIPSPTSDGADAFWMDVRDVAAVRCTGCHDADPWVHSPWIDQIGKVPRIGTDPAYDARTKYSVLARDAFQARTRSGAVEAWEQPQVLADAGRCGSCHRIGKGASLAAWTPRSVGANAAASWLGAWVSDAYRTSTKARWMPPGGAFGTEDAASVRAILTCAANPEDCAFVDAPH